jgi:hypothetical protein
MARKPAFLFGREKYVARMSDEAPLAEPPQNLFGRAFEGLDLVEIGIEHAIGVHKIGRFPFSELLK